MKKQITPQIKAYLLNVLLSEDHTIEDPTATQLFSYAKDRFMSEYGWAIPRQGLQGAIREWLLGLALNVEYTYYDIEVLLKVWSILDGSESEKKRDKELDLYWDRLACELAKAFKKIGA
jgi:hypothetical protein